MDAPPVEQAAPKPKLRGVVHQISFFAFLPAFAALLMHAPSGRARLAVAVYAFGLLAMLGVSALYHRGDWGSETKRKLRRLDHSTILLAIAGTYTPIAGLGLHGRAAAVVVAVVWTGAVAGIAVRMLWIDAPRWLVAAVYLVVGWTAVAVLPKLAHDLGGRAFLLVLAGGLLYSAGAAAYATKRPEPAPGVFGFHEVFHTFVVAAAAAHFAAAWLVVGSAA
jgi:hemolysin III